MTAERFWSAPWARGLTFGAAIGVIVGIFTMVSSSGVPSGRGSIAQNSSGDDLMRMGPGAGPTGPALPARDQALLNVVQEYVSRRMWPEAEALIGRMKPGTARDMALDLTIKTKVDARLANLIAQPFRPGEARTWIDSLRREAEAMDASSTKVDRLIMLAQTDTFLERRPAGGDAPAPGGAGGAPAPKAVPIGPESRLLLARAEEVALSIPEAGSGGLAAGLSRTAFLALIFGLLGMAVARVASSRAWRPGPASASPSAP